MSRTLGLAGVQMTVADGDGNLDRMAERLAEIRRRHPWVELVVFSELCLFGNHPRWAQSVPGPATERLCELARRHRLWLVPGSLSETASGGGVYNTAPVISPQGRVVARYRKMYPWRPRETSRAGDQFCVFDVPGAARVGLCICYDQWFPEVVRQLAWMGAELVLVPTMTTTADRELELTLARANAVANQLFVFSVNGLGHGGNGRSLLVDPEGRVLQAAGTEEAVLAERIDLELVERVRERGTLGLCQVLKSFRDGGHRFPVYEKGPAAGEAFCRLGPIDEGDDTP